MIHIRPRITARTCLERWGSESSAGSEVRAGETEDGADTVNTSGGDSRLGVGSSTSGGGSEV